MKNKTFLLLICACLLTLPVVSFAQNNAVRTRNEARLGTTTGDNVQMQNRETIRNEIENKKEALKQKMEQKREEIKNSVEERRQNVVDKIIERVNQFVINIITRYEAAVNRLEILVNRIESRMAKIEERDIDVSEAKDLMAAAKTKIEIARASILDIASTTDNTLFGTTTAAVKGDYEAIRTQMVKAKKDIRAAHAALVDVVNSLKPGDNKLRSSETDD